MRLLLTHAKQEFTDEVIGLDKFESYNDNNAFEFNQIPTLTDEQGNVMCQSMAALRFLGKKFKCYSEDPMEMWVIDSTLEALQDIYDQLEPVYFKHTQEERI